MGKSVIIIGGGLAGLTAAIHLSKSGVPVILIEKNEFPKHKVCGEYISNEVLPYFEYLGVDIASLHPANITKTSISTVNGKQISSKLPLGGFGISRYALDYLLYKTAIANGCQIVHGKVTDINYAHDHFTIKTEVRDYEAKIALGAFGKRANIDLKLGRKFVAETSPWLAVKAHYSGDFPDEIVALHNFRGGYCGVSKVENGTLNVCYLADFKTFKQFRDIDHYQQHIVSENPYLNAIFKDTKPIFKPLAISQISFGEKLPVEDHILMIGDTAGLIHPLCGNGMAMAIHSAKIASELIVDYFSGKIESRKSLENRYVLDWNLNFRQRLRTGRWLAELMRREKTADWAMKLLTRFPKILPFIIRQTHGKPLMPTI
jgi:flavin-dependent dehydrogenase